MDEIVEIETEEDLNRALTELVKLTLELERLEKERAIDFSQLMMKTLIEKEDLTAADVVKLLNCPAYRKTVSNPAGAHPLMQHAAVYLAEWCLDAFEPGNSICEFADIYYRQARSDLEKMKPILHEYPAWTYELHKKKHKLKKRGNTYGKTSERHHRKQAS